MAPRKAVALHPLKDAGQHRVGRRVTQQRIYDRLVSDRWRQVLEVVVVHRDPGADLGPFVGRA